MTVNRLNFPTTKGFLMKISMKLIYQYIHGNFSLTSNHLHSLQAGNCDSNSLLVMDEDDYDKLRLERVMVMKLDNIEIVVEICCLKLHKYAFYFHLLEVVGRGRPITEF